ncbi:MAG: apolipoprotein N-acyltransferase [Deltaproteobacteria bacterium]|nr:apolipoprotein N-acyltransferase [Deltaproteobacteria bacterium]
MLLLPSTLALLSSALIFFTFPDGPLPHLAWIAFCPFALAISNSRSVKSTLVWSIPYSITIWYLCTWWFVTGLQQIGSIEFVPAALLSTVPAIVGAVPYLAFALIAQHLRLFDPPLARPACASALLTLMVHLWPTPFPGHLAHSLYRETGLLQLASLGGESLLLLLINATSFVVSAAVSIRGKRRIAYGLAAIAIPAGSYLYGMAAHRSFEAAERSFDKVTIGMVQPNIAIPGLQQEGKTNADYLKVPGALSRKIVAEHPDIDLVVWPEIPLAFSVVNQPRDFELMDMLSKDLPVPLLISDFFYTYTDQAGDAPAFFNAMHLLHGSGEPKATYVKNKLIPFGEFVPLENHFPILGELFPEVRRYTAGTEPSTITIGTLKIAPAICLEAIYSSHIADLVSKGANIIINPGNDAYFGQTPGPRVHLALSTFRAYEYRIPLVRVTNSGLSEAITASGRSLINGDKLLSAAIHVVTLPLPPRGASFNPNRVTEILCMVVLLLSAFSYLANKAR